MSDATPVSSMRRNWPYVALALAALAVAAASVLARRGILERAYAVELSTEAKRRAIDVSAKTMSGDVMGAVSTMGLVNRPLKADAQGAVPPNSELPLEPLRANGEMRHATAMYVVDRNGIVRTSWYTTGNSLTGLDVSFRTYFQQAMLGKQNVSAGTSATTGRPALYVAAPMFQEVSSSAPIIGAVVARLGTERVDSVLTAWSGGPALLLSPQQVVFLSSRRDWAARLARDVTPEQLEAMRALKQFSSALDSGPPSRVPFDVDADRATVEGVRYAVARAPVLWNDPQGQWTLVLLGQLDTVMSATERALIAAGSGALSLILGALFIAWRRRVQVANAARAEAEAAQQAYAVKLYFDSEVNGFISEVSTDLHAATTRAEFARTFMTHVTTRVAADYGVFYVFDRPTDALVPVGGYGVLPETLPELAIGEGLVGQCAHDRALIVLNNPAQETLRIVWGAGSAAPSCLLFLPLVHSDDLMGVVAFAAVQPIDDEQRAVLDALVPNVAINLALLEHQLGASKPTHDSGADA